MTKTFTLKVLEEDDILTEEDVETMKLPFDQGWEAWAIAQGEHLIGSFTDFKLASRTCSALNHTIFTG